MFTFWLIFVFTLICSMDCETSIIKSHDICFILKKVYKVSFKKNTQRNSIGNIVFCWYIYYSNIMFLLLVRWCCWLWWCWWGWWSRHLSLYCARGNAVLPILSIPIRRNDAMRWWCDWWGVVLWVFYGVCECVCEWLWKMGGGGYAPNTDWMLLLFSCGCCVACLFGCRFYIKW